MGLLLLDLAMPHTVVALQMLLIQAAVARLVVQEGVVVYLDQRAPPGSRLLIGLQDMDLLPLVPQLLNLALGLFLVSVNLGFYCMNYFFFAVTGRHKDFLFVQVPVICLLRSLLDRGK